VRLERLADAPSAREASGWRHLGDAFPEFMHHDPVANRYFGRLRDELPDLQLVLLDADDVVAEANTIGVAWDGVPDPRGVDWALERGFEGPPPTTLCALQARIRPDAQGRGLSRVLLEGMRGLARSNDLDALIAPVRPTLKHRYPLIATERYAAWRREDGMLFDPWLRAHERLGAEVLGVAPESMTIPGTVAEWEEWAGMELPESGEYVVPGALVPVCIDREAGTGLYVEPNIWMRHPVG
jgi:GNAT superfamily N-acetyltransferase